MQYFDWNEEKAESNFRKHGIRFADAARIFEHHVVEWTSPKSDEHRILALGRVNNQIIAVVYTWRGRKRWLISARPAKRKERRHYEQES